jgi:hypothetical protein
MAAEPAHAYVRTVTSTGLPVWWRSPCIAMDLLLGSPPPAMTGDAYLQAAHLAASAWSHTELACSGLALSIRKTAETSGSIGFDGRNIIVLRADTWCSDPPPTDPTAPPCYSTNALAVTTVFRSVSTGEIVDADMEVNAVDVVWADLVHDPSLASGATADFQNMLTHELGHVIGLAHPCYIASDGPNRLLDNQGQPEFDCSDPHLPTTVADATMFPSVSMADTLRRTLSPDDAQATCEVYPSSGATCSPGQSSGCSLAPPASRNPGQTPPLTTPIGLGVLALLAALWYRRR